MTSDIERIVHDGLHAELEALIPDGLTPERGLHAITAAATTPVPAPNFGQRWRLPLLAAAVAVVALITVPFLRRDTPPATPPAATTSASTGTYIVVGPKMSDLLRGRAVTLLAAWDQAAPNSPTPTRFDNSQLSGAANGVDVESVHAVGTTLTLSFAGSSIPKNQNCGYGYTASALTSTHAIAVVVQADPGTWPGGPNVNCAAQTKVMTVTIILPEAIGKRAILDVSTGMMLT